MKTLILYASQTGTTKKYADWLHESIKDSYIENLEGFPIEKLNEYDQYIIGSYTHGGQSPAQQFVIDNWNAINTKKIFLFLVGVVPQKATFSKIAYKRVPEEIRSKIGYKKLPGEIDKTKSSNFELKMLKFILKGNPDSKVDRKEVEEIINYFE